MTGRILLFVALTILIAFALTGGIARWLGRLAVEDQTPDDGVCVVCGRSLPLELLEPVKPEGPDLWCVDLTACLQYKHGPIGVT
jgi:hypothetical protein